MRCPLFAIWVLLGSVLFCPPLYATEQMTSVAVLDFYNLTQASTWQWLGKGLADMLITDLSASAHLNVLDREGLQAFRREMALSASGLMDEASVLQLGNLAQVDKVLFGVFRIENGQQLHIRASWIDVKTTGRAGRNRARGCGRPLAS